MADKYAAIFRGLGQIAAAILLTLVFWNWHTVNEHDKTLVAMAEQISFLKEKSMEIVPRSENERRYSGIELNVDRNYQALQNLQQSCYEALSDAKSRLNE